MNIKAPELVVFEVSNTEFTPIGVLKYTSLIWPNKYNGYSSFELHTPMTEENKELLKKDRVIWSVGKNAAKIEIIDCEFSSEGKRTFTIKGRTLEAILESRIVWTPYICTNKHVSTAMYDLVKENCIDPSISTRKIPYLYCATDTYLGRKLEYQESYDTVYDALVDLSQEEIGFTIDFLPEDKKLQFRVYQGKDLSNTGLDEFVVLSTLMEDILSSDYYLNTQPEKNIALVAGEDSSENRKKVTAGESSIAGFARKELYVDARDLQSTVDTEDGSKKTLTDAEYLSNLTTRGLNKLSECRVTETFEAKIRTDGSQYDFDVDYTLGDKILIQDPVLGIQISGRVTEIEYSYGSTNELTLTFGYSQPSIIQRLKQSI